jgi:CheY-like chemotaxis protein
MLKMLNFNSETSKDGEEALKKYKDKYVNGNPFSFMIMDLTIPGGIGGKEAINNILEIDPSAKIIASSGYSNDPVLANYKEYGFKGVLMKPYTLNELKNTIFEILLS